MWRYIQTSSGSKRHFFLFSAFPSVKLVYSSTWSSDGLMRNNHCQHMVHEGFFFFSVVFRRQAVSQWHRLGYLCGWKHYSKCLIDIEFMIRICWHKIISNTRTLLIFFMLSRLTLLESIGMISKLLSFISALIFIFVELTTLVPSIRLFKNTNKQNLSMTLIVSSLWWFLCDEKIIKICSFDIWTLKEMLKHDKGSISFKLRQNSTF